LANQFNQTIINFCFNGTNMEYTNIISTKALHEHLGQPGWVVVDCRFDLSNPSWGFEDYQRGHIPGAIYANLDRDLSSPVTTESGRHPLPAPQEFAARLYAWGITPTTQVVV
jgi:thiosulfate/3-mercaptopyruvate sulfurtransferase